MEHVIRNNASLGHLNSLVSGLWVAVEYPTAFETISLLDPLTQHLDEVTVVNLFTKVHDSLAKAFTKHRLTLNEEVDDVLRTEVNHACALSNNLGSDSLTACWQTNHASCRSVNQILRHGLAVDCVLAWLL